MYNNVQVKEGSLLFIAASAAASAARWQEIENPARLMKASEGTRHMYTEKLELLIDGHWRQGSGGVTEELINPATGEVLEIAHASADDLDEAPAAAARGFRLWKNMTAIQRYAIMEKAAELSSSARPGSPAS
ncbi:MAG: aldehyde dehydrogenase family protein [Myxococcales bacterium]